MTLIGDKAFGAVLAGTSSRVTTRTPALLRHHGLLYQNEVRAHASGRPGPRVITGVYRRSIVYQEIRAGTIPAVSVGTNAAQGRRLELGFVGTDSAGRTYNQPPYPHFEPPLAARIDALTSDLADLIAS